MLHLTPVNDRRAKERVRNERYRRTVLQSEPRKPADPVKREYRLAWERNHPEKAAKFGKAYHRARYLAKLQIGVGITPKADKCELCGKGGRIVFDHCHKSKVFRGWLCHSCNLALGLVHDDVALLQKMIAYLSR